MPVQEYTINIRKAVVGALYGMSYTNSERHSARAVTAMGFGLAVQPEANEDRVVKLGVNAKGELYGVTIRTINMEQTTYPGTGEIKYKAKAQVAFVREGTIQVKVLSGASTMLGEVFVDTTTGEFHSVTAAGRVLARNARWSSIAPAGGIARLTITIAKQTDAVAP